MERLVQFFQMVLNSLNFVYLEGGKFMSISDEIQENLKKRRSINQDDDFGLERSWEELTNILSKNEDETIKYLMNCSKDDVLFISSVFDYVSENLQSKKFISCLRELDKKYPDLKLTSFIDDAEDYIKDN
ncbi:conserved hypothetical protein [Listeria welshimeri serovar 6b str. SLCC5334]|uniref:Uncharacterized protein n=2 Tax=Listeria welshimeri TaxID=1643 RepID=A0AFZ1_LISW6|nr:conserved hypothetical protein [Listeria welshimeri serovar 6b str. SLCC5334]SNV18990.1 Uncharacterised protein [Listeria welshimeri]